MATTTISGESLRRLGGVGAALEATVLCVGIVGLIVASPVLQPWLAVLFGINAALGGMSLDALSVITAIDIVVLALAAIAFAGFWPGPGKPHRAWMGLAILLPLAGIAVLLATGLQGRSGLMGGGLVLSVLLIGNRTFRPLGYLGAVANLILLIGDFGTSGAGSALVASLVAFGYVLLVIWFAWTARFLMPRTSSGPVPRSGGQPGAASADGDSRRDRIAPKAGPRRRRARVLWPVLPPAQLIRTSGSLSTLLPTEPVRRQSIKGNKALPDSRLPPETRHASDQTGVTQICASLRATRGGRPSS